MAGKPLVHQLSNQDQIDPFQAGQMVGMLVILTFIEKNDGISGEALDQIKWACANNVQNYLQKPSEDIFLMVNNIVNEIEKI